MKTCEEWSTEFDLMYDNITSNQAPGLTEYEKSVFLTRAQNSVVVMLYNGTLGKPFEQTEETMNYLAALVKQVKCPVYSVSDTDRDILPDKVYKFSLPSDLLFRIFERCTIETDCGSTNAEVVPIPHDYVWRTTRNPFQKQNSHRVLRLTYGEHELGAGSGTSVECSDSMYSELVSDHMVSEYFVRYIRKPYPIITESLEDGLSIDEEYTARPCELHEALHQTILTEAVKMAKAVWSS